MPRPPRFDPEKWSRLFDKPYVMRDWHNYNFGRGFKTNYGNSQTMQSGRVLNSTAKHIFYNLHKVLDSIIDGNWDYCVSLYTGFIAFLFKDIRDQITFFDADFKERKEISLVQCTNNLSFPSWSKDRLEQIFDMDLSFEDFLIACDKNIKKMNFDLQSALDVYLLQGDDAIFSILMQIFYYHRLMITINVVLTPGLPIVWKPNVSEFVTGTSFPVVVSPWPDYLKWVEHEDGWFLQDSFGSVMDCAGVGLYNCLRDPLSNRLSFCGRVGDVGEFPYIVCRSWGEVVDALHFFGVRNVLVRRMNEGLVNTEFFKFGLDALLCVRVKGDGDVCGRNTITPIHHYKIPGHFMKSRAENIICSLSGDFIRPATDQKCVWSNRELEDWFLLGEMCRT